MTGSKVSKAWTHLSRWKDETDLKKCVIRFFEILDTKETNSEGNEFSPVYISSCRVMSTEELGHILSKMKELVKE